MERGLPMVSLAFAALALHGVDWRLLAVWVLDILCLVLMVRAVLKRRLTLSYVAPGVCAVLLFFYLPYVLMMGS